MTHSTASQTSNATSWLTVFRRLQGELTGAEQRCGIYFEANPDAAYRSITEVVEDSGLGYGTIVRFCQKLGFKGFQEFKLAMARDVALSTKQAGEDSDIALADRMSSDLHETIRLLDYKALEQAAKQIAKSKRLLIVGVASSAPLAISLAWKLKRVGVDARASSEGYVMSVDAFLLQAGDLLVAVSSSGATKDVLHAAEVARNRGAKVLAITNFSSSPLSKMSQIALYTSANRDPLKAEVPSLIPGEAIAELLLNRLIALSPKRQDHLVESFNAVSNRKL